MDLEKRIRKDSFREWGSYSSNNPFKTCLLISNCLGLIWRGARWILQNACAGVCYYKIYKMQRALQKPSSKCEHIITYFASNFLGLIWRGARWILQNACAEVCYYKTQSASQKPSALAPAYCQPQETVCLAK